MLELVVADDILIAEFVQPSNGFERIIRVAGIRVGGGIGVGVGGFLASEGVVLQADIVSSVATFRSSVSACVLPSPE